MLNSKHTIIFSTYDDINNPHYGGGGAIAVHKIAKQLALKYTVKVISWDYCGKKKEIIDGVPYERFGYSWLSPKLGMFAYQLGLFWQARKKTYDLWLESFCPPFTTAMLPLYTKKPIIGIVHMLAAEDMERKYKLPFHIIQNAGLRLYNSLIVTSEGLKHTIRKIVPQTSVTVISNGVDNVYPIIKKKQPYILFVGRIEMDQKGIDLLLKAYQGVHQQLPGISLVLVGGGADTEIKRLKELIKELGVEKQVILKGKVLGKEKETLLQNAMAVVVPSRFETFSIVALEAMAHGAPLVCFAIDGLSWIPKRAAIKVHAFDIPRLTKALIHVVSDRILAESITTAASDYAKGMTWNNLAKEYEALIIKSIKK